MIATRGTGDAIPLSVHLPGSLTALADERGELSSRVRRALQQNLDSVLARFGIPGTLAITMTAEGPDVADGGRILRVAVDGRIIRYPDELLQQAWCYLHGQPLDPQATVSYIQARLTEDDAAAEFLSFACSKIVEREPAALLGPAQCRTYASALGADAQVDVEHLREVLRQLLDLHISIADWQRVAEVLHATRMDDPGVFETLVASLRRDSIDIRLDKPTLRQLTASWPADSSALFPFLREGLFLELGVSMPRYRFVIVDDQRPGSVAFGVNDLVSVPMFGLQPWQVMVNDTAERLRNAGFENAAPISNPATGQPNGVIDASVELQATAQGFTTWNQAGHLILSLAEFLRRNGWRTVHRGGVQRQLRLLGGAFSALSQAVRSRHTDDEITAVLRGLVRDRVSVQNLRAILESLLDLDLVRETPVDAGADGAPARSDAVAHVRTALGPAIAHQAARGTDTVVVYLVDPEVERLTAAPAQAEKHADSILDALRKEMAYLPPTAQLPSILTSMESRATLQRLVATEQPRMSVIAHEELPPGRNVQPVARVAL